MEQFTAGAPLPAFDPLTGMQEIEGPTSKRPVHLEGMLSELFSRSQPLPKPKTREIIPETGQTIERDPFTDAVSPFATPQGPPPNWSPQGASPTPAPSVMPGTGPMSGMLGGGPAPPLAAPVDVPPPRSYPAPVALPPTSAPASGPAPAFGSLAPATAVPPSAAPATSLLSRIGDAINAHPNTLLSLAAGFANAQNIGQGMQRAFSAAGPAMEVDRKQRNVNQTVQFLRGRGYSQADAEAIAGNPDVMKQLLPQLVGAKQSQFTTIGEDALGNKRYGFVDPVRGTVAPYGGSPAGTGAGQTDVGGLLARGVTQVDPSLSGDAYLKQFSPEVQSSVRAYIEGRAMPTGNPRKGFTQFIKETAQRVGDETGQPVDDATFRQRNGMLLDLAKTTPGSMGGQITFARTALGHLSEVAKSAEALDNSNGWGFAPLASVVNNVRGLGTEQAAKVNALNDAVQHYGQEITKFYAGSPGGEAERQRFLSTIGAAKSPKELAAAISQERALIPDRLSELENRIGGVLGPSGSAKFPVHSPQSRAALSDIDATVSRMRGFPAAGTQPGANAVPPNIAMMSPSQQMEAAPEGSIMRMGSGRYVKHDGRWQPLQ
jgi:hypothetical protein